MKKINIKMLITKYAIIIIALLLFLFFSIVADNFFSASNVANLLRQVSINGICAVGMACVIITGGIDISVGGVIGISGVLCAYNMSQGMSPLAASLLSLLTGTLIGSFSSLCVTKIGIAPMIATMGVNTALRGAAYLITGGTAIFNFPKTYSFIGQGYIFGVPVPVIIMIIVFAFGVVFLNKTKFSRYLYGVGANEEVARLSGVNVAKVKLIAYAISGFCASLAGLVLLGRVSSGQPKAGDGYEMDIITAVVMGGVSLTGGEGKIQYVIFGVLVMGILSNGMTMLAINDYWQRVAKGLVLLLAVGFDRYLQKKKAI